MNLKITYKKWPSGYITPYMESWDSIEFTEDELKLCPLYEPHGPSDKIKPEQAKLTKEERWSKLPHGEKATFWTYYYYKNATDPAVKKREWNNLFNLILLIVKSLIVKNHRDIIGYLKPWCRLSPEELYIEITAKFMERFKDGYKGRGKIPEWGFSKLLESACMSMYGFKKPAEINYTDAGLDFNGDINWELY